jgi:hypothetical protein
VMGAEAARHAATHLGEIRGRHQLPTETDPGGTTRRARPHVENPTDGPAAQVPEPIDAVLVADDRVAVTECRHGASKHPGAQRRSAPQR